MKRIVSAELPDIMIADLDEIAARKDLDRSKVIRRACAEYIKRNKRRPVQPPIAPQNGQEIAA